MREVALTPTKLDSRTWLFGLLLIFGSPLTASNVASQLRPYEPADWEIFDGETSFAGQLGATFLSGQRVSLAGERGPLRDFGAFNATVRTGRVGLSASGTLLRTFSREDSVAPSHGDALPDADGYRHDAGDYRISTTVRLTPADGPALAILRFGTRLPTTDNKVGLERDQIDFFAIAGARVDHGPIRATAEAGVGIHGTRNPGFEQSDVLVYIASIGIPGAPLAPTLLVAGHADGLADRYIAGSEELAEVRLRLRTRGRIWVQTEALAGLMEFSPLWGLSLSVGTTR